MIEKETSLVFIVGILREFVRWKKQIIASRSTARAGFPLGDSVFFLFNQILLDIAVTTDFLTTF